MNNDTSAFMAEAGILTAALNAFADKHNLSSFAFADHIGFRCESHEAFQNIRDLFEKDSAYIYQSIISNRPIAVIKLSVPLETNLGPIQYLELSDQKPDGSQVRGFDHIEIVPKNISYDELRIKIQASGENIVEKPRPHHATWDIQLPELIVRLEEEKLVEKIKREEMS